MKGIFDGLDNARDPTQRDYCSFCVFGDLGRGKSTFLAAWAKKYAERTKDKKVPRKVLICDPSRASAFNEFPPVTLTELKYGVINPQSGKVQRWNNGGVRVLRDVRWNDPAWFQVITRYFQNGLVILDESRNYIPQKSEMPPEQKEFFTIHRNNCVDVMVVSHDFMNMNLWLRKAFRVYIVFRTGDRPDSERWFEQRSLPEELFPIWQRLQIMRSPSAKMSPFYIFDRDLKRSQLCADLGRLELLQPDPANPGQMKLVPYSQIRK